MANLLPPALSPKSSAQGADTNTKPTFQRDGLAITGAYGLIFQVSKDRVRKMPKIFYEGTDELRESNRTNRLAFKNEKAVYERLVSHDGIIRCFKLLDSSTELALASQGNLEEYIQTNSLPYRELRSKWIRLLVNTFDYVHSCKVVLRDVALRNILLDNNSLKLCDFGESFLLPLDTSMEHFCAKHGSAQK
ncbi:hypothetical protein BDY21DRAFT_359476 [Lineolata rhizophorae]|uniref:non-specific serine/threonine protein kinase n=1 Tax=Lineolata rhizophorae TaxID=578093 RepID=A0A6A6NL05_9PEZI|nr:hypothetical protein BDY21DRAFT_359476 [Lineolata rhizophorae]